MDGGVVGYSPLGLSLTGLSDFTFTFKAVAGGQRKELGVRNI